MKWSRITHPLARSAFIVGLVGLFQSIAEWTRATPLMGVSTPMPGGEASTWVGLAMFFPVLILLNIFLELIPERTLLIIPLKAFLLAVGSFIMLSILPFDFVWYDSYSIIPELQLSILVFVSALIVLFSVSNDPNSEVGSFHIRAY